MENTTLVALSRQVALRHKLDVIANNVANLNTAGFKRQTLEMDDYVMPTASANTFPMPDEPISFVVDWTTSTDFQPGTIDLTGGTFDVAVEGDGFFVVQTPDGERYTRAGNFQLDPGGRLVTPDGHPVLGEGGEIVFGPGETDVVIGSDGSINTNEGPRGRFEVVSFADNRQLEKIGDNLFAGADPQPVQGVRVRQGALELSNVQAVMEMTRLIDVNRAYAQVTSFINTSEELRLKALNLLGDVTV